MEIEYLDCHGQLFTLKACRLLSLVYSSWIHDNCFFVSMCIRMPPRYIYCLALGFPLLLCALGFYFGMYWERLKANQNPVAAPAASPFPSVKERGKTELRSVRHEQCLRSGSTSKNQGIEEVQTESISEIINLFFKASGYKKIELGEEVSKRLASHHLQQAIDWINSSDIENSVEFSSLNLFDLKLIAVKSALDSDQGFAQTIDQITLERSDQVRGGLLRIAAEKIAESDYEKALELSDYYASEAEVSSRLKGEALKRWSDHNAIEAFRYATNQQGIVKDSDVFFVIDNAFNSLSLDEFKTEIYSRSPGEYKDRIAMSTAKRFIFSRPSEVQFWLDEIKNPTHRLELYESIKNEFILRGKEKSEITERFPFLTGGDEFSR
ncbi:hypothetical protein [Agaribacterium sp. ZY112]|uniref:hypothetical protein n=1 Tax=Agaribacterium sp. ZY112 TaxID=3233574 RepID=UPI003525691A